MSRRVVVVTVRVRRWIPAAWGGYYDLVRVPHGHIPVPLVRGLWRYLPLPVREFRTWEFYECPLCGTPSFFKGVCWECQDWDWAAAERYYSRRRRREYFRAVWKRVELWLLPLLLLLGRAWYVRARR